MKLFDNSSKKMFRCTLMENVNDRIIIYDRENNVLASIPSSQARLIFNEREIQEAN